VYSDLLFLGLLLSLVEVFDVGCEGLVGTDAAHLCETLFDKDLTDVLPFDEEGCKDELSLL